MENNNQRNLEISFKEIIIDGLKLFKKTYTKIIPIFLLFSVISIIFKVFSLTEINYKLAILTESSEQNSPEFILLYIGAIFIEFIIVNFFLNLSLSIVSLYLYKIHNQQEGDYKKDLKETINKRLILILFVLAVVVPFAFILIIPGLLIYGYYIFSIFTNNLPEIKKPLSKAKNISGGNLRRIIIIFLIGFLIIFSGNFISNLFFIDIYRSLIISRNYGMLFLYYSSCNLLGIILSPLIISLLTSLFSSCFKSYKKELKQQKPIRNKDYSKR